MITLKAIEDTANLYKNKHYKHYIVIDNDVMKILPGYRDWYDIKYKNLLFINIQPPNKNYMYFDLHNFHTEILTNEERIIKEIIQ